MAIDYHEMATATDRGAYQATPSIVSFTDKRDVSEMLDLLALSETPLINRIGWGSESGGTSIEWISEDLGPGYIVVGSVVGSAGVSIALTTVEGLATAEVAKQLQTGSIMYGYSSTDGYHAIWAVNSVSGITDIGIEVLSTGTAFSVGTSLEAAQKVWILGAAANEGSKPRQGMYRDRAVNSNGFTILRQDVQITGSHMNTDFYAINREDKHQLLMRLKEMQREREKMALYSVHVTPRASTEASLMNGALGFLVGQAGSNIDTSTTSLTETAINTVVGACWESGAENLSFFGNLDQCAKFTRWDKNRIRIGPRENKGGGMINHYLCECGIELEVVPMRKVPNNIAFVLDTSKIKMRAKKNRKALMEKLGKMGDFEDWQIVSEFSMEMKGYNLHQHGLFTRLA